jgi:hypothetical protein
MPLPGAPLERKTVVTALGIRFWDAARDTEVREGLVVTARLHDSTRPVVGAFTTGSGVYAFQGLPGLQEIEYPSEGRAPGPSASPQRYTIEVADRLDRFVPVVFGVELPLAHRGVYVGAPPSSPPGNEVRGFHLFSAPVRSVPPGYAALRAQLVDHETGEPAAHAVLEVRVEDGETHYGVADATGAITILFPFPTLAGGLGISPPGAGAIPLADQWWSLSICSRWAPAVLRYPAGARTPDLRSIFRQSHGAIWPSQDGGATTDWPVELPYGRELVLRTDDRSTLLVSQGASPP